MCRSGGTVLIGTVLRAAIAHSSGCLIAVPVGTTCVIYSHCFPHGYSEGMTEIDQERSTVLSFTRL